MNDLMTGRARKIRDGLTLLLEQLADCTVDAQHDVIYAGGAGAEGIDAGRMGGWHWDEDFECWAFFT